MIRDYDYEIDGDLLSEIVVGEQEIVRTEASSRSEIGSLGQFLVRADSISSSKIERVDASSDEYARALAGLRSNPEAGSMVSATAAMSRLVERAGETGSISLESILLAQKKLMEHDPMDSPYAGDFRTMQNWIGGSDYSPRGAIHVPPPPEMVAEYMEDLIAYVNRDDMPATVQASIAHAQFESIHPFTDGNGRIGRALVNAIYRRRGLTERTVVPVASAMVSDRQGYFDRVNEYRNGSVRPFISDMAGHNEDAAIESRETARILRMLPQEWMDRARPRRGSTSEKIIGSLLKTPVMSADLAEDVTGSSSTAVYSAMAQLEEAEVVYRLTDRKRNQVWGAGDVIAEFDELTRRIATRASSRR